MAKISGVQKRHLLAIVNGAKIKAQTRSDYPNRWYFTTDADGINGTVYLCITMRSLMSRGMVHAFNGGLCTITESGLKAAGLNNPITEE